MDTVAERLRTSLADLRTAAAEEALRKDRRVTRRRVAAERRIMLLVKAILSLPRSGNARRLEEELTKSEQMHAQVEALSAELGAVRAQLYEQEQLVRRAKSQLTLPAREAERGYFAGQALGRIEAATQGLDRLALGLCPVVGCEFHCPELELIAATEALRSHIDAHRRLVEQASVAAQPKRLEAKKRKTKRATPKRATPKRTTPKRATPKRTTPKRTTPRTSPRKHR